MLDIKKKDAVAGVPNTWFLANKPILWYRATQYNTLRNYILEYSYPWIY